MEREPNHSEALPQAVTEPITSGTESGYPTKTERQREALGLLEQGIDEVLTSEGFAKFLKMVSTFHDYSMSNILLIMVQKPDATRVASYDKWKAMNRQVKKGEHGIKIYFPMFSMREEVDLNTGELKMKRSLRGFGLGNVFDVSQTDGEPLPEPPPTAVGDTSDARARDLNLRLSRWGVEEGIRMESIEIPGHARGYYAPKENRIAIRREYDYDPDKNEIVVMDPLSIYKTKTLVHELAHYVGEHKGDVARADAETIAESVAFSVMNSAGLDTSAYSFNYVAYWAKDKDVFKRNLGEIQRVTHVLLDAARGIPDPLSDDFSSTQTV